MWQGVAHRDLKPENVIMTNKDCDDVKICDFGMAALFPAATNMQWSSVAQVAIPKHSRSCLLNPYITHAITDHEKRNFTAASRRRHNDRCRLSVHAMRLTVVHCSRGSPLPQPCAAVTTPVLCCCCCPSLVLSPRCSAVICWAR